MVVQNSELVLMLPLAALVVEDFRSRTVSLLWLIIFSVLSVIVSITVNGLWPMVVNTVSNLSLLLYMAIGIAIYFRIKHRHWLNPFKEYVGSGDALFLMAVAPMFGLRDFLLLLICGSVFSLLWMLLARLVCRRSKTIPFVATMGITLSAAIIISLIR